MTREFTGRNVDKATKRVLTLQRWGPDEERELSPASEEVLVETIRALGNEHSAILAIGVGGEAVEETDRWLAVNANDGLFSVSAQLGIDKDDSCDLVGDAGARGMAPFVLGGQLGDYPCRYLVSMEQALAAALEFFRTGTVDVEGGGWDQYGPGSAWVQEGMIQG